MIAGLMCPNRNADASSLRVFSYPYPAPRWIVPRSRRGPQSVPSGRDSGMWVNKTVGLSYFSGARG